MKVIAKNEFKYWMGQAQSRKEPGKFGAIKCSPPQFMKIIESKNGVSFVCINSSPQAYLEDKEDQVVTGNTSIVRKEGLYLIYIDTYNKLFAFDYSLFVSSNAKPVELQRLEKNGASRRIATVACDGTNFCIVSWLPVFTELDKDPNFEPLNEVDLITIGREMPSVKTMCDNYLAKLALLESYSASPNRVLSYLEFQVDALTKILTSMIGLLTEEQILTMQADMDINKEDFDCMLEKLNESSVLEVKKDFRLALLRMAQKKGQFREVQLEYLKTKYLLPDSAPDSTE